MLQGSTDRRPPGNAFVAVQDQPAAAVAGHVAAASTPYTGKHCTPSLLDVAKQLNQLEVLVQLQKVGYSLFVADQNRPITVLAPRGAALQQLASGASRGGGAGTGATRGGRQRCQSVVSCRCGGHAGRGGNAPAGGSDTHPSPTATPRPQMWRPRTHRATLKTVSTQCCCTTRYPLGTSVLRRMPPAMGRPVACG